MGSSPPNIMVGETRHLCRRPEDSVDSGSEHMQHGSSCPPTEPSLQLNNLLSLDARCCPQQCLGVFSRLMFHVQPHETLVWPLQLVDLTVLNQLVSGGMLLCHLYRSFTQCKYFKLCLALAEKKMNPRKNSLLSLSQFVSYSTFFLPSIGSGSPPQMYSLLG